MKEKIWKVTKKNHVFGRWSVDHSNHRFNWFIVPPKTIEKLFIPSLVRFYSIVYGFTTMSNNCVLSRRGMKNTSFPWWILLTEDQCRKRRPWLGMVNLSQPWKCCWLGDDLYIIGFTTLIPSRMGFMTIIYIYNSELINAIWIFPITTNQLMNGV